MPESAVGYICLPPLERSWFRRYPDPQLAVFYADDDDHDIELLYLHDVITLRRNRTIGSSHGGVVKQLTQPTDDQRSSALSLEDLLLWLRDDTPIDLDDAADQLAQVLATYPLDRQELPEWGSL
ncbi:MAG: hypothetical protein ABIS84_02955 [Arachnia sp.]